MDLKDLRWKVVNWIHNGWVMEVLSAGWCVHNNERKVFITCGEFLDWLRVIVSCSITLLHGVRWTDYKLPLCVHFKKCKPRKHSSYIGRH